MQGGYQFSESIKLLSKESTPHLLYTQQLIYLLVNIQ